MAEQFGPYHLEELIGRGGMGEVFRAADTLRKRTVALKRLRPESIADPEFDARFRAESELAARLRSAHVIPIHDYGEIDGRLFIDMRLVDGEDMGRRLKRCGALPAADVVPVIGQVAGALDAAHAAGLLHRDVKPSNVLLSPSDGIDGRYFAYLVDFGIARSVDDTGLTGTGHLVGTLDYMAPERFSNDGPDHRADVYSLACVLFEALTGTKPFTAESIAGLLYSHVNAPPPRPSTRHCGVSPAFDAVIGRGMAKDPRDRHPTAGALAAAARAALTTTGPTPAPAWNLLSTSATAPTDDGTTVNLRLLAPGSGGPATAGDPPPSRPRRRGRLMAAVAAVTAAVVAAAVAWVAVLPQTPAAADPMRMTAVLPIIAVQLAMDPAGGRYYTGS